VELIDGKLVGSGRIKRDQRMTAPLPMEISRMTCSFRRASRPALPLKAILAGLGVLASTSAVLAQDASDPLAPPAGNHLVLKTSGAGTQDYICLPSPTNPLTTSWVFERPQAVLSTTLPGNIGLEVAEHALLTVPGIATTASAGCTEAADGQAQYCPSWRNPLDQSTVWGSKIASVAAGSAADCPHPGAVACLLLKAVATTGGDLRTGVFGATTFIQRLNTEGGAAPTTPCSVGQIEQVPYRANYLFYAADRER
jgi:hypothetical protein